MAIAVVVFPGVVVVGEVVEAEVTSSVVVMG